MKPWPGSSRASQGASDCPNRCRPWCPLGGERRRKRARVFEGLVLTAQYCAVPRMLALAQFETSPSGRPSSLCFATSLN